MVASLHRGVLYLDGKPRFVLATDYPYFRDDARHWRARLRAQAAAGLDVLTCYVPWRHHAPEDPLFGDGEYDFTGRTQPNRDLAGLLDAAREEGLLVVLKPGPFVHAELPFGGLPTYVCAECHPEANLEPEVDAHGQRLRWTLRRMSPASEHVLPAPFGERYNQYARDWLEAVARVAAPRAWPHGPVVAAQLMNEGIYSETARTRPAQFAFARSTLERYRNFLSEKYGDVDAYNRVHGARARSFDYVDPPRRPTVLHDARDLLAYLDWSEFQGRLYLLAAQWYKRYLVDGGMPGNLPVLFNFNPNGETYRDEPAANDGWYTRVNVPPVDGFAFGVTNWLGVVANDPGAFRQYVMANTAFRGPAMEQNWGFSSQYYAPYEDVTPSAFEAMLAVACGATGFTAYTFAGTRAWRDDPNLRGEWVPERTNDRQDETRGDYPGDAPVLSDGRLTSKYWTLRQMAQFLSDEGARFVETGPRGVVAWAIYPPYAWAGQWLPRGDPDDVLWRPPLKAVPRGAFHGLDAFVEMMTRAGIGFRQVDVSRDSRELRLSRVLCISAHEYMDEETQERLARHVEEGGRLLLTNLVPEKDLRLRPLRGALAERVFPHREGRHVDFHGPRPLSVDGRLMGHALEFANVVAPPPDADTLVRMDGDVIGYRRRVGRGWAFYLGVGPWRAVWSGDDRRLALENQDLAWRLVETLLEDERACARPVQADGEVVVFEHGEPPSEALFVVVRDRRGDVEVALGHVGEGNLRLRTPSQAVHALALEDGRLRAGYLKGVNDVRGERVAPQAEAGGARLAAGSPCDLCVTRAGDGALRVSVAHAGERGVGVTLPVAADEVARVVDEAGEEVPFEPTPEAGVRFEARDVRLAGTYRVELRAAAREARTAGAARRAG